MTSRHTQVIIPANKDMFMRSPKLSLLLLGILALSLSACSTRHSRPVVQADMRPTVSMNDRQLDNWQSLSARLQHDGLDKRRTSELFARLDLPPSSVPMGVKVKGTLFQQIFPQAQGQAAQVL